MNKQELIRHIRSKRSFLCVGLDSDPKKLPAQFTPDAEGVLSFNRAIIDATAPYAVAFKPNAAFYEALGWKGVKALEETIRYIRASYPDIIVILDAKRGDIGNTSALYARSAFEELDADVLTVAPYMGNDSVSPFLKYDGKWVAVLALTSNGGSEDFQHLRVGERELFEEVLETSKKWGSEENMMYVAGATHPEYFKRIRAIVPEHFLLVPGVGAQGGSLEEVAEYGMNRDCGLLVNSSRGIIFASREADFAQKAGEAAKELQAKMSTLLDKYAKA